MQLVAYGAQDVYLTGNPQVTFFKQLYKRHTNFAMQSVEAGFNGNPGFGKRASLVVPRVGDLMGRTYFRCSLPALQAVDDVSIRWVDYVGNFLIKNVEVQIGGQIIDKHYGIWMNIWASLTISHSKRTGYNYMIGYRDDLHTLKTSHEAALIHVPFMFWFCKHEGLALPLIALQYHEVRLVVEFESLENLVVGGTPLPLVASTDLIGPTTYVDYIFLDTDERRKFAQTSHEYLIEQLQFTGDETFGSSSSLKAKLNFNHPVKELIWVIYSDERKFSKYGVDGTDNPLSKATLQFNGHDRFSERNGQYFGEVQPWQHHTHTPDAGINLYSFALYPELEQPSGTSNFSRIDNTTLKLEITAAAQAEGNSYAKIYAVNYNVLRIMSGMGGLAYSN